MKEIKKKGPKPSPIKSKQKSIKIREDLEEVFMDSLYELRKRLYTLYPRVIYTREFKDFRDSNYACDLLMHNFWTDKKGVVYTATEVEKMYFRKFDKSPFANGCKK